VKMCSTGSCPRAEAVSRCGSPKRLSYHPSPSYPLEAKAWQADSFRSFGTGEAFWKTADRAEFIFNQMLANQHLLDTI